LRSSASPWPGDFALCSLVVVEAERSADIDLAIGQATVLVPPDVARVALVGLDELALPCRHDRLRFEQCG
jgi:hypothetical protein